MYYGSGILGDVTISTHKTLTDSVYHYDNLTINAGVTLTFPHRSVVFVKGTLSVNGTLTVAPGPLGGLAKNGFSYAGQGGAGGAAGGSLIIIANSIVGTGIITAKGSVGGNGSPGSYSNTNDNSNPQAGNPSSGCSISALGLKSAPNNAGGASYSSIGSNSFLGIAPEGWLWQYLNYLFIPALITTQFPEVPISDGGGGGSAGGTTSSSNSGGQGGPGGAGGSFGGAGGKGGWGYNSSGNGSLTYEGAGGSGGGGAGGFLTVISPSIVNTITLDVSGGNGTAGSNGANLNQNTWGASGGGGGGGGGGLLITITDSDILPSQIVLDGGVKGVNGTCNVSTVPAVSATNGGMGILIEYQLSSLEAML